MSYLDDTDPAMTAGPTLIAVAIDDAAQRTTPAHRHARGQVFGAQRGLLTVTTENSQWVVPACHAVWIPPRHQHALRSCGPFSGWSAYILAAACTDLPAEPCTLHASGLLREAARRATQWRGLERDTVQTAISRIIVDEIRTLPRVAMGLPMPRDTRLRRIVQCLANDLSDTRRLDEWAQWAGIATRTLSRHFVAETGLSLAQWRQRARLFHALERLADGSPVTTVAIDLGYDNVSAFIALFKTTFGVTPGRYFAEVRDRESGR